MALEGFAREGLQCLTADLKLDDRQAMTAANYLSGKKFDTAETARVWLACALFRHLMEHGLKAELGWEVLRTTPEYDAFIDSCFDSRVAMSSLVVRLLEHAQATAEELGQNFKAKIDATLEFFEAGLQYEKDAALALARARVGPEPTA
jgi:hypothetical protein